jgi:hypothetical protein
VPAGIARRFRLYDGAGAYIYPEGKPAHIAGMIPAMTLDAVMSASEAAAWRGRITPARETDGFARNPLLAGRYPYPEMGSDEQ